MFTLVIGEQRISLVDCIWTFFGRLDEYRIYVSDVDPEVVLKHCNIKEFSTAQIYLRWSSHKGSVITKTGLRHLLDNFILEVDNGHYPLWSREKLELEGYRGPWPVIEEFRIVSGTQEASNTFDNQQFRQLITNFLED